MNPRPTRRWRYTGGNGCAVIRAAPVAAVEAPVTQEAVGQGTLASLLAKGPSRVMSELSTNPLVATAAP